jgi:hypothetical protein
LDISSCNPNATEIYIGASHFRGSLDQVRQLVPGVQKGSSKEQTTIVIESTTGAVVHGQQFTQLNLGVVNGSFAWV